MEQVALADVLPDHVGRAVARLRHDRPFWRSRGTPRAILRLCMVNLVRTDTARDQVHIKQCKFVGSRPLEQFRCSIQRRSVIWNVRLVANTLHTTGDEQGGHRRKATGTYGKPLIIAQRVACELGDLPREPGVTAVVTYQAGRCPFAVLGTSAAALLGLVAVSTSRLFGRCRPADPACDAGRPTQSRCPGELRRSRTEG